MPAPVVLPADSGRGEAVIRVCALRQGETVEAVLRCGETSFGVDHVRATFHGAASPAGPDASGLLPGGSGRERGPATAAPEGTGQDGPPGGIVDGTDLYGPVYFQTGRLRRVAFLPEVSSRSCRALVRGGDDQPWFGAVPGPVDAPLILGSPGLNDATSHVLQACLPHHRVLVAGCDSLSVTGREVRGAVQVRATRRPRAAGVAWDVTAADATGQVIVAWTGLRLQSVGPLAGFSAWHPALLAAHLEGRAAELGLDPDLRVAVCFDWTAYAGHAAHTAGSGSHPDAADPGAGSGPAAPAGWWASSATGTGPLAGLELRIRASRPVACYWEAAGSSREGKEGGTLASGTLASGTLASDPWIAALGESAGDLLRLGHAPPGHASGQAGPVSARLRAVAACLAPSPWQPGGPLAIDDAHEGGWVLVRAGATLVACTVLDIAGVPGPVALSMATWPDDGMAPVARRGAAGQSTSASANGTVT
jgi:enediyne polyketide synthase